MSEEVLVERRDGVMIITINRPQARNALNAQVAHDVAEAVDELDASDQIWAAVLTGAGGTFCSGMDLKGFLKGESPSIDGRGLCGITETPPKKPLIAAVEGWALAGGFELTLACDMVVAGEGARFGVPEVKRGLVAGAGAALLLARRIPQALALELLLLGEPFDAARAADIGLINRVVPTGTALDEAVTLARQIAGNGPLAVAVTKDIARSGADWPGTQGWIEQNKRLRAITKSADAREGAAAFAEKRAPVWTGR